MSNLAVKVAVIERERGWGSRVDDYMVCLSLEDAHNFKIEYNSKNNLDYVPDWYMKAEGDPTPIDLTDKQYKKLKKKKRMWLSTLDS